MNEPAFSYDSDGDTEPETELETEEESDVAPGTYRPRIWVADAETDTPGVEAEVNRTFGIVARAHFILVGLRQVGQ